MSLRRVLSGSFLACGLMLAGGLAHPCAHAQVETAATTSEDVHQTLYVDLLCFAGALPPKSRLDVFVQVGYENLTFVKHDDRYDASYDLSISIQDTSSSFVNEKSWSESVKGLSFDESVSSSAYSLTQRIFPLDPGRYTVTIIFRDNESKTSRKFVRQLLVPDFATPQLSLSDIMLISKITTSGEKKSITPNVTMNVGTIPDAFYVYLEVYNKPGLDSLRLLATVITEKEEEKLRFDTLVTLHPGRNEKFLRIAHSTLPLGDYRLVILAVPIRAAGKAVVTPLGATSRPFIVRWQGLPRGVNDITLAIEQLRYIAKDSEMSSLKDAKTPEEKQKWFITFWKKRDPNPNTPRNERMEEYYARVEYANKHFKHYIEGWRTDMGMVFIIFGPPSDVARHPFEIDSKPYEVWQYYGLNYDFVFVDQTGFGDYRLTTPISEALQRRKE